MVENRGKLGHGDPAAPWVGMQGKAQDRLQLVRVRQFAADPFRQMDFLLSLGPRLDPGLQQQTGHSRQ